MKTTYMKHELVQMPFTEHSQCECRLKKAVHLVPLRQCQPCVGRRRVLDPGTCECRCSATARSCQLKGRTLNRHACR
nr:PREDICTED: vascular endothelial growth factor B [Lepisosteus oculatus]